MLILPASTQYEKRIPKQKFYDNLSVSTAMRRVFIDCIDTIIWRNKLSAGTLNLPKGETVSELEILQVNLKQKDIDAGVFELIDRQIPYHILFLLAFGDEFSARIGYKEASSGKTAFKVDAYYQTGWMAFEDLPLSIDGLSLDAVYENLVRQIAGTLLDDDSNQSLQETVQLQKEKNKLLKKIATLESRICKEKQFNKKAELNLQIKQLRDQFAMLSTRS